MLDHRLTEVEGGNARVWAAKWWKTAICLFTLLAEAVIFYRRVLFTRKYGIPYDLDGYHQPLMGFIAASLRHFQAPLWDPYSYCGVPFYANVQAQLFYPPAWPFYILAAINQRNTFRLLEIMVVLHVFLAGAFTYWLLRRIGLGRGSAVFGGTVFELGGFFASQTSHVGAMCGATWIPLAWLGVLLLAERWTWRRLALLALAVSMSILAGFPATMAVVVGSSILLAVLLVTMRRARVALLVTVAGAVILGFLLSTVQLLPSWQLMKLSLAGRRGDWTFTGGGVPLEAFVSMVAPDYYHIFEPGEYDKLHLRWNPTFFYLYCGIAGLVLGLLGALWAKHKLRFVMVALTVVCAFWMLCDNTPLGRNLFPHLPATLRGGFYPEFANAGFLLGFTVLAALGAERLLAQRGSVVMAVLVIATAYDLIHQGANSWMNTNEGPGVTYQQIDGSRETLAQMRAMADETVPPGRLDIVKASHNWAGAAPMLHVPTANGDDPGALWRMLQLRFLFAKGDWWGRYYEVAWPGSPVVNLLNIRFLLSAGELPAGGDFFRRKDLADGTHVYENRKVLPRFFLVSQLELARGLDEALQMMRAPTFDPTRVAVIEGISTSHVDASAVGSVSQIRYSDAEAGFDVETSGDAFLVTSEAFFPGWRVWIDGREADLVMTNAAFRGLPIAAGTHHVLMRFAPRILWYGIAISAASFAFLVIGCLGLIHRGGHGDADGRP